MRRMFLIALLATVSAIVVLAPTASAAKFDITSFTVTSAGLNPNETISCGVTLTLNYNGKVNSTAKEKLNWNMPTGLPLEGFWTGVQATGSSITTWLYAPAIQTGATSFSVTILDKNSRVIRQTGNTSPTYTATAGTCPTSGTSLGSWTNPNYP